MRQDSEQCHAIQLLRLFGSNYAIFEFTSLVTVSTGHENYVITELQYSLVSLNNAPTPKTLDDMEFMRTSRWNKVVS